LATDALHDLSVGGVDRGLLLWGALDLVLTMSVVGILWHRAELEITEVRTYREYEEWVPHFDG